MVAKQTGTSGGDYLVGDQSERNLIEGMDGDDILIGGAGDDIIFGGGDDDRIIGGEGDDAIAGHEGDDALWGDGFFGGTGDDSIAGGSGDDIIYGGGGDDQLWGSGERPDINPGETDFDTFVFMPGHGNDTVHDFNLNEDRIDLSHFNSVTGLADLSIQQQGANTMISVGPQSGDSIQLMGVNASDLDAGDFIFHGAPDADAGG